MHNDELNLNILRNIESLTSQKNLANEITIRVGKINNILKLLVEKAFIKTESVFENKNKNQYKYLLTEGGNNEKVLLRKYFIKIKKTEYKLLQAELDTYNMNTE
ncbi:MAG: MarR family EPS-associated transcriptional regulator [Campylobacteraceae bacterium]|nr:MarR family EPS-associated transcriptional regulator [Campylobacteraceae bacterium]